MSVEVRNISKKFEGGTSALNDVSLKVESGELIALLGPSGSGKTTLLRIIGGLEFPDNPDARVLFHDKDVTSLPAHKRGAGFAFQHYALFRHLTVFENIAFGLRVRSFWKRPKESKIRERVGDLLKLVQLEAFAKRYPSQLSGGQRQRVALARALAVEPKVLLLDEPFGALDAKVRKELRHWLRTLHEEIHVTTLFVTHDQEEALEVAGRVAILREGKIEQIGTPEEIHDHPATPFVYDFLGNVNLFKGRVRDGNVQIGDTQFDAPNVAGDNGLVATAFVRPHDVIVTREPAGPGSFPANVVRFHVMGLLAEVELHRADSGETFTAQLSKERFHELNPHPGERVYVELHNVKVFPEDYSI
ncbi:MAG TPA: sulfate/molybdate ABC transporter ATP-binding protein [Verrucomicrobiae bacterium]|jgi:sulfate transport system ATP-binding protein|nr:sulfate/molybdate ABC transporter ATP-binding protein [Verrucomicrobiae bacterium]